MGLNAKQRRKKKLEARRQGESGEAGPGLLNRGERRRRDRALSTLLRLDMAVKARKSPVTTADRVPAPLKVPPDERGFEKRASGLLVPGRKRRGSKNSGR